MDKNNSPLILHTETYGSGPTLVLLHGFLASSRYWAKVSQLASQHYKVIAVDLLGFGNSPKPRNNHYGYDDQIASINATLKQLGVTQPFILMGHSMGALIALRYARIYEERVKKLVLTNMPVLLGAQEVKQHIVGSSLTNRLGLTPFIHRIAWATFRAMHTLRLIPKSSKQRVTNSREFVFQHTTVSRMRSFRRIIMEAKTEADLAAVNVKTTVLSGLHDQKAYIDNLMYHVRMSPQVALEYVETGHHIPNVMPEKILEKLR